MPMTSCILEPADNYTAIKCAYNSAIIANATSKQIVCCILQLNAIIVQKWLYSDFITLSFSFYFFDYEERKHIWL